MKTIVLKHIILIVLLLVAESCKKDGTLGKNQTQSSSIVNHKRGVDKKHPGFASLTIIDKGEILLPTRELLRFGCEDGSLTVAIPTDERAAQLFHSKNGSVTSNNQEINGRTAAMAMGALSINGVSCDALKNFMADDNASAIDIKIQF